MHRSVRPEPAISVAGGNFPGALGALGGGQIAALHAVVHILCADGTERFVVEADAAGDFAHFLGKTMHGAQMVGGGRKLAARGLEELLKAMVDEVSNLFAEEHPGAHGIGHGRLLAARRDDGGAAVF
ncbi:hypothetical protein ACP_2893 [Acidobacterium capsulatum ATCC 51196]|uniref:Uncharacterized protein n=1 Tax=Acidobacterium capsulatum (strain ATCC 51196 / DSM 11244 / BCRC 80197 / JCM 7670 / NBRC 15755 / NCIMB 13165 / 161) TaxID=240015 RepID=C1F3V5_ACIC5|nr:hypothetical protein ACP_2893 [Acidobacterium capsulatum ATCC 51196]